MAFSKLPLPGNDAFKGGALDNRYLGKIVERINRDMRVTMPPGVGIPKVIQSEQNVWLDFSTCKINSPQNYTREFDIQQMGDGTARVMILDGTVMGKVPETPNNLTLAPDGTRAFYTLTVADGDKIWIKLVRDAQARYVSSAIEAGANVPADATGETYYKIGSVDVATAAGHSIVTPVNTRWGPIELLKDGCGTDGYDSDNPVDSGNASAAYLDLTETGLGKEKDGSTVFAGSYWEGFSFTVETRTDIVKGSQWEPVTGLPALCTGTATIYGRQITVGFDGKVYKIGAESELRTFDFVAPY